MRTGIRSFPAELDYLDEVLAFAEEQLEAAACPMKAQSSLLVCLEEIFVNVAMYAYPERQNGEAHIEICTDDEKKECRITVSDQGIPFNPLEKEDPDVSLSAEQRKIGGLGIFMVKKMMDEVDYYYTGGKNILSFSKKF